MTNLDQLGVLLTDLPIYLANGVLVILYWLAAHSAALVSLACALRSFFCRMPRSKQELASALPT